MLFVRSRKVKKSNDDGMTLKRTTCEASQKEQYISLVLYMFIFSLKKRESCIGYECYLNWILDIFC